MPALTVKNIPDELYERLKASARSNHRSINGELIHRLETCLTPRRIQSSEFLDAARILREQVKTKRVDISEIDAAKREGRE